jgi:hypothetical protein
VLQKDTKKPRSEGFVLNQVTESTNWKLTLKPRYLVEIKDSKNGKWYEASVMEVSAGCVKIHYSLW